MKNVCTTLNYIEHFLVSVSEVSERIPISASAFLLSISIGIKSSPIGLKMCTTTAGCIRYKSIIKKKKTKHDKIVLLAKYKLNSKKVLLSKTLIDSNISHDEFVVMNNALKEYDNLKKEIENLKT